MADVVSLHGTFKPPVAKPKPTAETSMPVVPNGRSSTCTPRESRTGTNIRVIALRYRSAGALVSLSGKTHLMTGVLGWCCLHRF